MLKLFRKIRQNLLSENKFRKYLIYAIGEIILVVIGILMALQINTANQNRLKEEQIESILNKIQREILLDLRSGEELIDWYNLSDSLSTRIILGQLSYDELAANRGNFQYRRENLDYTSIFWKTYNQQNNGYKQLMSILDDLPDKYDDLVALLNKNYLEGGQDFATKNKNSEQGVQNYKDYLVTHYDWYARDAKTGILSDEQIDFILHDPFFKNCVSLNHQTTTTLVYQYSQYHDGIMHAYLMIQELLGEKAGELPGDIRTTSLQEASQANRFTGNYQLVSGSENTRLGKSLYIRAEGKDLYAIGESDVEYGPLQYLGPEKPWFILPVSSIILRFDYHQANTISILQGIQERTLFTKVIDQSE
jgi:hypothetical protein